LAELIYLIIKKAQRAEILVDNKINNDFSSVRAAYLLYIAPTELRKKYGLSRFYQYFASTRQWKITPPTGYIIIIVVILLLKLFLWMVYGELRTLPGLFKIFCWNCD